jgi:hypothetical protein
MLTDSVDRFAEKLEQRHIIAVEWILRSSFRLNQTNNVGGDNSRRKAVLSIDCSAQTTREDRVEHSR